MAQDFTSADQARERYIALCEAHMAPASDAYFKARPAVDDRGLRRVYEAGFRAGFDDGFLLDATISVAGLVPLVGLVPALNDVAAERVRQQTVEGWTPGTQTGGDK